MTARLMYGMLTAAILAGAITPVRVAADEVTDSQRHGRLCLAAMEVDNFGDGDFWCSRAAQDFAAMAGALAPGRLNDVARLMEAFYLGRVALANRTIDHDKTTRFIEKTTALYADLIKHGADASLRRSAEKGYLDWVKAMRAP